MNNEFIRTFSTSDRILTKDEPAEHAYMVLKGRVAVFLEKDGKRIDLATLAEGEIFGESALFHGEKYGANVEALDETVLEIISPGKFEKKLNEADPVVRDVMYKLIERQRKTNDALLESETREFMDVTMV